MNYFDEYVFNYDMDDEDINYKYHHSYRVMNIMEQIATRLNMNEKDVNLAKIIGLLHDIGRFEQDKLYDSFKDTKMDHGDYGVDVIKRLNFLDRTNIDLSDYEVVYKAIDNHNQFKINEGLTERELLFAKLIRDADKLDILYALGNPEIKPVLKQDNELITDSLKNNFFNNELGNVKHVKNKNDGLITSFCYIYDINFKETYEIIYENQYYNKIYKRIERKDIFKPYLEYLNKYIKERIN